MPTWVHGHTTHTHTQSADHPAIHPASNKTHARTLAYHFPREKLSIQIGSRRLLHGIRGAGARSAWEPTLTCARIVSRNARASLTNVHTEHKHSRMLAIIAGLGAGPGTPTPTLGCWNLISIVLEYIARSSARLTASGRMHSRLPPPSIQLAMAWEGVGHSCDVMPFVLTAHTHTHA